MRILITNTGPWGTGSFTVTIALFHHLKALGHQVHLFFPDSNLPSKEQSYFSSHKEWFTIWQYPLTNEHIALQSFPLIIPDPHPRSTCNRTYKDLSDEELKFYFFELEKQLKKVIEIFQPDVIESQHIWTFEHVLSKFHIPYFCTAHHSDQMGFLYDDRMRNIILKSIHKLEKVFAISRFVKQEVQDLYHLPEEKVLYIPNGFDQKTFYPFKVNREEILKELNLTFDKDVILVSFAGKISKTKGIDILLKANKMIPKSKKIHFLILGAGNIDKLLGNEDLNAFCFHQMHFLGHQSAKRLAEIHNICDFSVLPSRSEGFGIACLEAMGCGLPIITTNSGGQTEYVVGKIIPKENPVALAEAVIQYANLSEKEKSKLQHRSIETAKKYSWESIAKQRIEHYMAALKKPA